MPATYSAVFAKPLAWHVSPRAGSTEEGAGTALAKPTGTASEGSCLQKTAPAAFRFLAGVRAGEPRPSLYVQQRHIQSRHRNALQA